MFDLKALYVPDTVDEALALLKHHPDARVMAGGSDNLVKLRDGKLLGLEWVSIFGLDELRRIELDAEKPVVNVTSALTNTGAAPRTACLRVHPEFAVEAMAKASVRIRRADGTWRVVSLANPADPNAEKDEWLRGAEVPAGAWALVDEAAGVTLVNRVKREQIGQCLLNWSGAKKRANLELYSNEKQLAPGESLTLEHSYSVD